MNAELKQRIGNFEAPSMQKEFVSVKFLVTEICNFACKYCFSGHGLRGKTLPLAHAFNLINALVAAGCKKLSFIGGEPTLYTELPELIKRAKSLGLVTTIVTNGTGLTDTFISKVNGSLDWVCLSIDSLCTQSLRVIGRTSRKQNIDADFYYKLADKVKGAGHRLKINTVVNSINYDEDLSGLINYTMPERWRIFKVLPVTARAGKFAISSEMFSYFRDRHRDLLNPGIEADFVENAIFSATYVLVDPIGRIFTNDSQKHIYSSSILDVGVEYALNQIYAVPLAV